MMEETPTSRLWGGIDGAEGERLRVHTDGRVTGEHPLTDHLSVRRAIFCEKSPSIADAKTKKPKRLSRKEKKRLSQEWAHIRSRRTRTEASTQLLNVEAAILPWGTRSLKDCALTDDASTRSDNCSMVSQTSASASSLSFCSSAHQGAHQARAAGAGKASASKTLSPALRDRSNRPHAASTPSPKLQRCVAQPVQTHTKPQRRTSAQSLAVSPGYRHKTARCSDDELGQMISILCHSPSLGQLQTQPEAEYHRHVPQHRIQHDYQYQALQQAGKNDSQEHCDVVDHSVDFSTDGASLLMEEYYRRAAALRNVDAAGGAGTFTNMSTNDHESSIDVDNLSIATFGSHSFHMNRSQTASLCANSTGNRSLACSGETLDSIVLTPPFKKGFRASKRGRWPKRRRRRDAAARRAKNLGDRAHGTSLLLSDEDDLRAVGELSSGAEDTFVGSEGEQACDVMCNCVIS